MALNNFERLTRSGGGLIKILFGFSRDSSPFERLCWILGASEYFADACVRDTEFAMDWFWRMGASEEWDESSDFDEIGREDFSSFPLPRALAALRRAKRRALLRIGSLDYLGFAGIERSMARISGVADGILQAAFLHASRRILGPAAESFPLCVLAAGKLGSRELNYSSDVDLIFLHDESGLDSPEPFQRVAEGIVDLVSKVTEDGLAFRVDVRLRPHGTRGPLSIRLERAVEYYRGVARPWERVALVRARPCAGDAGIGRRFLEAVSPVIYPPFLGPADLDALKSLKRRSEAEARARRDPDRDLKMGPGGIRDVEFVTQILCVLYGSRHPALRTGNVLEAIGGIRDTGLMPRGEADALAEAYRFLRAAEHRVQTLFSLQVHEIPNGRAARAALARRLGFGGTDAEASGAFARALGRHRKAVRRIFERFLADPGAGKREGCPLAAWISAGSGDIPEGASLLSPFGFRDPERAARAMIEAATPAPGSLSTPERLREAFAAVAPRIAERLRGDDDPEGGLERLARVFAQAPAPAALFKGLRERPAVLDALVDIAAASPYLSEILATNPETLEPMLQALSIPKSRSLPAAKPGGMSLGAFRSVETLRIAARDLTGLSEPILSMRSLSAAAEAAVAEAFARAAVPGPARIAILALGRLGGREMGYSSDLDLVFLHGAEDDPSECARAAERLVRILEEDGAGFRVDARLRPGGKSSPLVVSLRAFESYHAGRGGAFWERIALTRARAIAGPPSLARAAGRAAVRAAFRKRPTDETEGPGLVRMRARQEQEADSDDLKRGPGGLADIEFLVSFLQILAGGKRPAVRTPSTRLGLARLARAGVLPGTAARELRESFDLLRLVESRIRIARGLPQDIPPKSPEERAAVARRSGFQDASALDAALERTRKRTRALFLETMARSGGGP